MSRFKKRIAVGIGVVAVITGVILGLGNPFAHYRSVQANGSVVQIPVSMLADGKVHFYKFADGGKEIAFFASKTGDGTYKAAFDACDSCYPDRKGYEQQGDQMNCKNCNQKFPIAKLGPNSTGGCNPGHLPLQQANGAITFSVFDLRVGGQYF